MVLTALNIKGKYAMSGKIVFDTNIIMDIVKKKYDTQKLKAVLERKKLFVSVITRMELFASANIDPLEEQSIRIFLKKCKVIPMNRKIEHEAVMFRRKTHKKLPDSIIAATAIILGASLITRDDHLLGKHWPGLHTLSIE
jgi:predicted nucleic acid-binding protein